MVSSTYHGQRQDKLLDSIAALLVFFYQGLRRSLHGFGMPLVKL